MVEDRTRACSPGPAPRPESPRPPTGFSTLACDPAPAAPVLGNDCWILSGPTAAGKSALAIPLARRLDAEIVSVDSMAVYRGLDIGTAKPTAADRRRVPHHLLDVVGPSEDYSVARWLADAADAVAGIRGRGRRILFVGGTPLFLRALREGLAELPPADPRLRESLSAEAKAGGSAALHARLAAVDPAAAGRIHPNDVKRIIRSLEVAALAGEPQSIAFRPSPNPLFDERLLVVDRPRAWLHHAIDSRVERMFADGLVEETRAAIASGGIGRTASQAAGYAEALAVVEGRMTVAEAIDATKRRTRQLAKRQLTWLRSFRGAVWLAA